MLGWIVRCLLFAGGVVASWFVAEDTARYPIVSFVATMLIFTCLVALVAFWGPLRNWLLGRRRPPE